MKKIILSILLCISCVFAANLNIKAYKNDILMMEYSFSNIKSWTWIESFKGDKFIRLDLGGNNLLDLPLNDYDVKLK